MNKTAKLALGVVAFAAPITAGWMVTASPSLLGGGIFSDHTIDEFEMSGHWVFREEIDGNVTEVVTGPDGQVLAPDEIPDDIADALADWSPPGPDIDVDFGSNPACYVMTGEAMDNQRVQGDVNGKAYLLRGDSNADGSVAVEAVVFDDVDDLPGNWDEYLDSDAPLTALPGAIEIGECP